MSSTVCVLGAGSAGLITAHTLLQDGFKVQVITRDSTPGGVWARARIYEGLKINNVHGEYRFSALPMPPPENSDKTGGRLCGIDLCNYMEKFASSFLGDNILYETEVVKIRRAGEIGEGWIVSVRFLRTQEGLENIQDLRFDKLVLCTGGTSTPSVPPTLSIDAARQAGFLAPLIHSTDFGSRCQELVNNFPESPTNNTILIVGGGKSAVDTAAYIARYHPKPEEITIKVVFQTPDSFGASKSPMPDFLRKSRFLSILSGYSDLKTGVERFFHKSLGGSRLNRRLWRTVSEESYLALGIPKDSPFRLAEPVFWSVRNNDEGVASPDSFFSYVNQGRIQLLAPARANGYLHNKPNSVLLSTGEIVENVGFVVLCTGYASSWKGIMDENTATDLGLNVHTPSPETLRMCETEWKDYRSLVNPPPLLVPRKDQLCNSVFRGIVPAKNILNRDLAINGAVLGVNQGYTFEVISHWISSYFLGDSFLRIPSSSEAASKLTERETAWAMTRYPGLHAHANESFVSHVVYFSWPQYCDTLLEDMGLKSRRSGGNWLTWPFKICSIDEIATLGQERVEKRAFTSSEKGA